MMSEILTKAMPGILMLLHVGGHAQVRIYHSTIEKVSIFYNGAYVERKARIPASNKESEAYIGPLPASVDISSVSLISEKGLSIISWEIVPHKNEWEISSEAIRKLEHQIKVLQHIIKMIDKEKEQAKLKLKVLEANISMKGNETLMYEDVIEFAEGLSRYHMLTQLRIDSLDSIKTVLAARIDSLQEKMREEGAISGENLRFIRVRYRSSGEETSHLSIRYFVRAVSWKMQYNIYTWDTSGEAVIENVAIVKQSTGEDWKNVSVELWAFNWKPVPAITQEPPPWKVRYKLIYTHKWGTPRPRVKGMGEVIKSFEESMFPEEIPEVEDLPRVESTATGFQIKGTISIPHNKETPINVSSTVARMKVTRYAIPDISNDVFIIGEILDAAQLLRIPGKIRVFLNNSMTGEYPALNSEGYFSDTLKLILGIDAFLSVKRTNIISKEKRRKLQNKVVVEKKFLYQLSNAGKEPRIVEILSSIPVSEDADIEVEISDSGGGLTDMTRGTIKWIRAISPEATLSWELTITISYKERKGYRVEGL